jgi:hypothetical protein
MSVPVHLVNWYYGWIAIGVGFVTGAIIGLFFHRDNFLGGYASFRRRILRLGHIALPALGTINVVYSLSPWPVADSQPGETASVCFIVGGITMSLVCFLCAWREPFRYLFFIPVSALVTAVVCVLKGAAW